MAGLRSILDGPNPLYAVARATRTGASTWRSSAAIPAHRSASRPGSASTPPPERPSNSRVRYEGGIVEVVAVTDIEAEVADADLRP